MRWAKSFNGGLMQHSALTLDRKDNVISAGSFWDTADFNPDTAVYKLSAPINSVVTYVSKLDSAGRFIWAGAASTVHTKPYDVVVDDSGLVYTSVYAIGGSVNDFDPGSGIRTLPLAAGGNGVVFKWGEGIAVTQPSSVAEPTVKSAVSIFPQPSDGVLYIRCGDASLTGMSAALYTLSGTRVVEITLQQDTRVDLSGSVPGLYFLRLPDGRAWKILKL